MSVSTPNAADYAYKSSYDILPLRKALKEQISPRTPKNHKSPTANSPSPRVSPDAFNEGTLKRMEGMERRHQQRLFGEKYNKAAEVERTMREGWTPSQPLKEDNVLKDSEDRKEKEDISQRAARKIKLKEAYLEEERKRALLKAKQKESKECTFSPRINSKWLSERRSEIKGFDRVEMMNEWKKEVNNDLLQKRVYQGLKDYASTQIDGNHLLTAGSGDSFAAHKKIESPAYLKTLLQRDSTPPRSRSRKSAVETSPRVKIEESAQRLFQDAHDRQTTLAIRKSEYETKEIATATRKSNAYKNNNEPKSRSKSKSKVNDPEADMPIYKRSALKEPQITKPIKTKEVTRLDPLFTSAKSHKSQKTIPSRASVLDPTYIKSLPKSIKDFINTSPRSHTPTKSRLRTSAEKWDREMVDIHPNFMIPIPRIVKPASVFDKASPRLRDYNTAK